MKAQNTFVVIGAALALTVAAGQTALAQDTNGNLFADSYDLRVGTSLDCNHNGVPDDSDFDRPHFSAAVEHLNALEGGMSNVWDVCPIDMDLDDDPDAVTTSMPDPNMGYVTFWRNEGGPALTFIDRLAMPDARPHHIRCADMNGDTRPDLVIDDDSWPRVYVFLATGNETFAAPIVLEGTPSNNGHSGLALGDIDNDGDFDIAATSWSEDLVHVWRNLDGSTYSTFEAYPVGFAPRGVRIGDFTGDTLADIAVANSFESSAGVGLDGTVTLLRNALITFIPHATLTMPTNSGPYGLMRPRPQDVALCDTDHDGDMDMLASSDKSQRLDLWLNDGLGNFALDGAIRAGYYIGSKAGRLLCRDLDNDGWEDIAWCDAAAYDVSLFKNTKGEFAYRQSFGAGNYGSVSVDAADFDGDGKLDLAIANSTLRTFSILKNTGNLLFDSALRLRPSEFPGNTVLADFTNDGITDYGAINQGLLAAIQFNVFPGLGAGMFQQTPIVTTPIPESGFYLARDVNHDSLQDLLIVGGQCRVRLGNGDGTFGPEIVNPPAVNANRFVITDINLDTHLDFVWIIPGHPGSLQRSLGDGAGNFAPAVNVGVVPAEDQSIGFGDLTGDGAPEIFSGHRQGLALTGGIFSVYPNNGNGTFGTRQDRFITGSPLNPAVNAIASADFDVDGDNDVVVSAQGLRLYVNPGNGDLPATPITVSPTNASILVVADIDLDTDPDLYGRASTGIVFLNNGEGVFDKRMFMHFYDSNARGMVIADVNNDGRQDMLIEPENSWDRYVYLNLEPLADDCNGDNIPDSCQIANGQLPDDDGDGIPDGCEDGITPGDVNGDGIVNINDLLAVIGAWGACAPPCPADLNSDGAVDVNDLLLVIGNWSGKPA